MLQKNPLTLSDDELLRLMVAGDCQAFTEVYRKYHLSIYRFARLMIGSRTVAEDANNSFGGNVQNVLEVTPAGGHSGMRAASVFGGPDTGEIALDAGIRKSEMAHEFTHLLGVDNRYSGAYLSNTYGAQRAQSATAYDYGWAFGGAINLHRFESRPIEGGRRWETLNAGGGIRGKERNYTSTHELGAPISWWR